MKKIYALTLCALLGASAAAASRFQTRRGTHRTPELKTQSPAPVMRPQSIIELMFIDGEWQNLGTTRYTYDSRGNATVQIVDDGGMQLRIATEFNQYDCPVTITTSINEGSGWRQDSKRTYVYDPVLHNYFIERMGFDWNGSSWISNYYCETNTITRNDDGNITEIVKSLPLSDEMIPAYKSVWNYDEATGRADEFRYYQYNAYSQPASWTLYNSTSYRDIEWEATDGQMTQTSMNEFVSGNNRIKSAVVYYENEIDGHFIVEYPADKPGDYFLKETFTDPDIVGVTRLREVTDDNGSYRITESEFFDMETGEPTSSPTYIMVQEVTIDDHGNAIVEEIYETMDGVTELVSGNKAEYVYNEYGYPSQITVSIYDYDSGEYVPESKTIYGRYSDVSSGIGIVTSGQGAEGSFTVYNLQGIQVFRSDDADALHSLPSGLYIVNGRKHVIR